MDSNPRFNKPTGESGEVEYPRTPTPPSDDGDFGIVESMDFSHFHDLYDEPSPLKDEPPSQPPLQQPPSTEQQQKEEIPLPKSTSAPDSPEKTHPVIKRATILRSFSILEPVIRHPPASHPPIPSVRTIKFITPAGLVSSPLTEKSFSPLLPPENAFLAPDDLPLDDKLSKSEKKSKKKKKKEKKKKHRAEDYSLENQNRLHSIPSPSPTDDASHGDHLKASLTQADIIKGQKDSDRESSESFWGASRKTRKSRASAQANRMFDSSSSEGKTPEIDLGKQQGLRSDVTGSENEEESHRGNFDVPSLSLPIPRKVLMVSPVKEVGDIAVRESVEISFIPPRIIETEEESPSVSQNDVSSMMIDSEVTPFEMAEESKLPIVQDKEEPAAEPTMETPVNASIKNDALLLDTPKAQDTTSPAPKPKAKGRPPRKKIMDSEASISVTSNDMTTTAKAQAKSIPIQSRREERVSRFFGNNVPADEKGEEDASVNEEDHQEIADNIYQSLASIFDDSSRSIKRGRGGSKSSQVPEESPKGRPTRNSRIAVAATVNRKAKASIRGSSILSRHKSTGNEAVDAPTAGSVSTLTRRGRGRGRGRGDSPTSLALEGRGDTIDTNEYAASSNLDYDTPRMRNSTNETDDGDEEDDDIPMENIQLTSNNWQVKRSIKGLRGRPGAATKLTLPGNTGRRSQTSPSPIITVQTKKTTLSNSAKAITNASVISQAYLRHYMQQQQTAQQEMMKDVFSFVVPFAEEGCVPLDIDGKGDDSFIYDITAAIMRERTRKSGLQANNVISDIIAPVEASPAPIKVRDFPMVTTDSTPLLDTVPDVVQIVTADDGLNPLVIQNIASEFKESSIATPQEDGTVNGASGSTDDQKESGVGDNEGKDSVAMEDEESNLPMKDDSDLLPINVINDARWIVFDQENIRDVRASNNATAIEAHISSLTNVLPYHVSLKLSDPMTAVAGQVFDEVGLDGNMNSLLENIQIIETSTCDDSSLDAIYPRNSDGDSAPHCLSRPPLDELGEKGDERENGDLMDMKNRSKGKYWWLRANVRGDNSNNQAINLSLLLPKLSRSLDDDYNVKGFDGANMNDSIGRNDINGGSGIADGDLTPSTALYNTNPSNKYAFPSTSRLLEGKTNTDTYYNIPPSNHINIPLSAISFNPLLLQDNIHWHKEIKNAKIIDMKVDMLKKCLPVSFRNVFVSLKNESLKPDSEVAIRSLNGEWSTLIKNKEKAPTSIIYSTSNLFRSIIDSTETLNQSTKREHEQYIHRFKEYITDKLAEIEQSKPNFDEEVVSKQISNSLSDSTEILKEKDDREAIERLNYSVALGSVKEEFPPSGEKKELVLSSIDMLSNYASEYHEGFQIDLVTRTAFDQIVSVASGRWKALISLQRSVSKKLQNLMFMLSEVQHEIEYSSRQIDCEEIMNDEAEGTETRVRYSYEPTVDEEKQGGDVKRLDIIVDGDNELLPSRMEAIDVNNSGINKRRLCEAFTFLANPEVTSKKIRMNNTENEETLISTAEQMDIATATIEKEDDIEVNEFNNGQDSNSSTPKNHMNEACARIANQWSLYQKESALILEIKILQRDETVLRQMEAYELSFTIQLFVEHIAQHATFPDERATSITIDKEKIQSSYSSLLSAHTEYTSVIPHVQLDFSFHQKVRENLLYNISNAKDVVDLPGMSASKWERLKHRWTYLKKKKQRANHLIERTAVIARKRFFLWRHILKLCDAYEYRKGDVWIWGCLLVRAYCNPYLAVPIPEQYLALVSSNLLGVTREKPSEEQFWNMVKEKNAEREDEDNNDNTRSRIRNTTTQAAEANHGRYMSTHGNLTGPSPRWREQIISPPNLLLSPEDRITFESQNSRIYDPIEEFHEEMTASSWSFQELRVYLKQYSATPKNFRKIASSLKGSQNDERQCIALYYRHKHILNLKELGSGKRNKLSSEVRDDLIESTLKTLEHCCLAVLTPEERQILYDEESKSLKTVNHNILSRCCEYYVYHNKVSLRLESIPNAMKKEYSDDLFDNISHGYVLPQQCKVSSQIPVTVKIVRNAKSIYSPSHTTPFPVNIVSIMPPPSTIPNKLLTIEDVLQEYPSGKNTLVQSEVHIPLVDGGMSAAAGLSALASGNLGNVHFAASEESKRNALVMQKPSGHHNLRMRESTKRYEDAVGLLDNELDDSTARKNKVTTLRGRKKSIATTPLSHQQPTHSLQQQQALHVQALHHHQQVLQQQALHHQQQQSLHQQSLHQQKQSLISSQALHHPQHPLHHQHILQQQMQHSKLLVHHATHSHNQPQHVLQQPQQQPSQQLQPQAQAQQVPISGTSSIAVVEALGDPNLTVSQPIDDSASNIASPHRQPANISLLSKGDELNISEGPSKLLSPSVRGDDYYSMSLDNQLKRKRRESQLISLESAATLLKTVAKQEKETQERLHRTSMSHSHPVSQQSPHAATHPHPHSISSRPSLPVLPHKMAPALLPIANAASLIASANATVAASQTSHHPTASSVLSPPLLVHHPSASVGSHPSHQTNPVAAVAAAAAAAAGVNITSAGITSFPFPAVGSGISNPFSPVMGMRHHVNTSGVGATSSSISISNRQSQSQTHPLNSPVLSTSHGSSSLSSSNQAHIPISAPNTGTTVPSAAVTLPSALTPPPSSLNASATSSSLPSRNVVSSITNIPNQANAASSTTNVTWNLPLPTSITPTPPPHSSNVLANSSNSSSSTVTNPNISSVLPALHSSSSHLSPVHHISSGSSMSAAGVLGNSTINASNASNAVPSSTSNTPIAASTSIPCPIPFPSSGGGGLMSASAANMANPSSLDLSSIQTNNKVTLPRLDQANMRVNVRNLPRLPAIVAAPSPNGAPIGAPIRHNNAPPAGPLDMRLPGVRRTLGEEHGRPAYSYDDTVTSGDISVHHTGNAPLSPAICHELHSLHSGGNPNPSYILSPLHVAAAAAAAAAGAGDPKLLGLGNNRMLPHVSQGAKNLQPVNIMPDFGSILPEFAPSILQQMSMRPLPVTVHHHSIPSSTPHNSAAPTHTPGSSATVTGATNVNASEAALGQLVGDNRVSDINIQHHFMSAGLRLPTPAIPAISALGVSSNTPPPTLGMATGTTPIVDPSIGVATKLGGTLSSTPGKVEGEEESQLKKRKTDP